MATSLTDILILHVTIGGKAPANKKPTLAENKAAVRNLMNSKAPGTDFIQTDAINNAGMEYFIHLYGLIVKIWLTNTVSEECKLNIISPLHKKVNIMTHKNDMKISIL